MWIKLYANWIYKLQAELESLIRKRCKYLNSMKYWQDSSLRHVHLMAYISIVIYFSWIFWACDGELIIRNVAQINTTVTHTLTINRRPLWMWRRNADTPGGTDAEAGICKQTEQRRPSVSVSTEICMRSRMR